MTTLISEVGYLIDTLMIFLLIVTEILKNNLLN